MAGRYVNSQSPVEGGPSASTDWLFHRTPDAGQCLWAEELLHKRSSELGFVEGIRVLDTQGEEVHQSGSPSGQTNENQCINQQEEDGRGNNDS